MEEDVKNLESNNIKVFTKNLILEFLITFILLIILSILLSLTNLSESVISPSIIFISAFSILVGSFFSSRKIGKKGILVGFLQGFIYMFLLYLISSILNNDFSLGTSSLAMIGIALICGTLGRDFGSKLASLITPTRLLLVVY